MKYVTLRQIADDWGLSKRRVQTYCTEGRIHGAFKIGNMWVVPAKSKKPIDRRNKVLNSLASNDSTIIRKARRRLKTIIIDAFQMVNNEVSDHVQTKKIIVAALVYQLVLNYSSCKNPVTFSDKLCEMFFIDKEISERIRDVVHREFFNYINEFPSCTDDSISWAYQFANKISKDNGLETTQFFTEKYMISALVDSIVGNNANGKILDPACGGGNFLVHIMELLFNKHTSYPTSILDELNHCIDRLYGYELDPILAVACSASIRVKALEIASKIENMVDAEMFFLFSPNIYTSVDSNLIGALDINTTKHLVVQVGNSRITTLDKVLFGAELVFTNPPFQTTKGMDVKLREYLKEHYPLAKSDMCNAFIIRVFDFLAQNGTCSMVTQSSWMYLDSFKALRKTLLERYSINQIIELGSNAFYDLRGEKASVILFTATKVVPNPKSLIVRHSLKHLAQHEIEKAIGDIEKYDDRTLRIKQFDALKSDGFTFDQRNIIAELVKKQSLVAYKEFATPMQGTSTGDARNLVGFFWEHFGDTEWIPVSKGGGYSRWIGLNHYSVKWGENGEYIRNTLGSAIRNEKYFESTNMVYSDTGTAGLSVRILLSGQLFIASGPGIRITYGNPKSHLAFLNTRYASYYLRVTSPKLTISAGYIAKIPTLRNVLTSSELANLAERCICLKTQRLSIRPNNMEFRPIVDTEATLEESVLKLFNRDIICEWEQLCKEREIEEFVSKELALDDKTKKSISQVVGNSVFDINSNTIVNEDKLDMMISHLLNDNCALIRTMVDKNHLGCDGFLEFATFSSGINTKKIFDSLCKNPGKYTRTVNKFRDMYIHTLLLSALGYNPKNQEGGSTQSIENVMKRILLMYPKLEKDLSVIKSWVEEKFDQIHEGSFQGSPLFRIHIGLNTFVIRRLEQ